MAMRRMLCAAFLTLVCVGSAGAQGFRWGWIQEASSPSSSTPALFPSKTVSLVVPKGTPLQVALTEEVRVKKVGQPIEGLLVEPVYAFDQEVLPVGSQVLGRITELKGVSRARRFLGILNMNFTPARKIQVEFHEIVLPGGKRVPIKTVVTPGSGRPLKLLTTADKDTNKGLKDAARTKMEEAIREAKRKWDSAMKQVKEPGKMHRLKRYAIAQLPVHPQYIDAGTVYFAELQEPLDFGSKPLSPQAVTSMATGLPPCNLLAHALLITPLNSATTEKNEPVEAVLSRPVFAGDQLIFPQGSRLQGSVVQVQPARRFGRNGILRIAFDELVPPDGIRQTVDAYLEGVQAAKDVKLDIEGGAHATTPKKRYLATGITVALAVASYEDSDVEDGVSSSGGGASQGAAGGAAAFKLVGMVAGAFAQSQPLALGMGIYGAARSAYSNFVARGREVVFPKGTAMEIGVWLRENCQDPANPDSSKEFERRQAAIWRPAHWY